MIEDKINKKSNGEENKSLKTSQKQTSVSAGIIIFRRTEEGIKFLLLYHGGSYWNFPKGKLAEGEKTFKAALREVEEETGIKPRELRFFTWFKVVDRFTFYSKEKGEIPRLVVYYLAETKKERIVIQPREHQGYGWFLLKDALKIVTTPNLRRHLKKAYRLITSDGNRKNLGEKKKVNFVGEKKKVNFVKSE